jgi:transposase
MLDWGSGAASCHSHRPPEIRLPCPQEGGSGSRARGTERPIAGGLATPALLAQVLISRYSDHTPLYRQPQIFARHSVDLNRSTLAGWVGCACWRLKALRERLRRNVLASDHCLLTARRFSCSIRVTDQQ